MTYRIIYGKSFFFKNQFINKYMEYIAFLIPIITCLALLLFFRNKTVWWEYALIIIPTLAMFFGLRAGMISYKQSDTEYLGYYVTGTTYYEDWNEYIHQTCYRTVHVGKSTVSVPYDCSYVKYHSAYWTVTLNDKAEIDVPQQTYEKLIYMWNTPRQFIDMNRHYHSKDGDAYYNEWNGVPETTMNITKENSYVNKIKASKSVFSYQDISDKEAKKYKLYDYPKVKDMYQPTILSKHKIDEGTMRGWDFMNSYNGKQFEFRSYLIFFYNESPDIVNKQLSYWKGVNMNESNIFIGVDSVTMTKQWVRVQSWSDRPELDVDVRDYINQSDTININNIRNYIVSKIPNEWHRKNFKDFNYIKVDLTDTQITWLIILLLLYNIGISVYVIKNEFTNDEDKDDNSSYNKRGFYSFNNNRRFR